MDGGGVVGLLSEFQQFVDCLGLLFGEENEEEDYAAPCGMRLELDELES